MKTTITFHSCGLDPECNFLQAPICECGCGEYANLVLENEQEVVDFIGSMLYEHDCEHCAIFAIKLNGDMLFGQKTDEDILCYKLKDANAKNVIADMYKTFEFHCYGLLQQVDDDLYAIIME